jgi:hypothetical protein
MTLTEKQLGTKSYTQKIFNGVCGSRHEFKYGVVYDDEINARVKYWIKFGAFQQEGYDGNYLRDGVETHKVKITTTVWDDEGRGEEVHETILNGNPNGDAKIYFDITKAGRYETTLQNQATGNCSGGKCVFEIVEVCSNGECKEINGCWYSPVLNIGTIKQEEIDRIEQSTQSSFLNDLLGDSNSLTTPNRIDTSKDRLFVWGGIGIAGLMVLSTLFKS